MISTFEQLIDSWPKPPIATFARDIGITVEHGATMRRRGSIPPVHWPKVVEAAQGRGIAGVTIEALAKLAIKKRSAA